MSGLYGLLNKTELYYYVIFIIVSAILYKIIINFFQQRKILQLRKGGANSQYIRRSDLMKTTQEQQVVRNQADVMIAQGKIIEAAAIFEKANMQRDAVSLLEKEGYIDEACAILMRLQRPGRVASVYLRNKMYAKAGDYYLMARDLESAAKAYLEAGKTDSLMFEKAGRTFEAIPDYNAALQAYIQQGNNIDRIVVLSFQNESWMHLFAFMSKRQNAQVAMLAMTGEQLKTVISKLPLNENAAQVLALWSDLQKTPEFVAIILKKIRRHPDVLNAYWKLLPQELALRTVTFFTTNIKLSIKEAIPFLTANAAALFYIGQYSLAATVYTYSERHAMAAKCWAFAGNISRCLEELEIWNDTDLLRRCKEVIKESESLQNAIGMVPGQWHPKVVEEICEALAEVSPDSDIAAMQSPFSLVV